MHHPAGFILCAAALLWVGCGGATPEPQSAAADPASETQAEQARQAEETRKAARSKRPPVLIKGLEGSLSAYDVRMAMEQEMERLAECQAKRMRRVPHLSGNIELSIHVLVDGVVSQVDISSSDIGDRATEVCIAEVVRTTKFPKPHGGEADAKWSMIIDVRGRGPDYWDPERIEKPLEKLAPELKENCELTRKTGPISVTAYVGRSGRVLAVGAASAKKGRDEVFDCVTKDVKGWRLPKGKRVAKVTFAIQ